MTWPARGSGWDGGRVTTHPDSSRPDPHRNVPARSIPVVSDHPKAEPLSVWWWHGGAAGLAWVAWLAGVVYDWPLLARYGLLGAAVVAMVLGVYRWVWATPGRR